MNINILNRINSTDRSVLPLIGLTIPALLGVALFWAVIFWLILPQYQHTIMAEKRNMIRQLTETAWGIMAKAEERVRAGKTTEAKAQAEAAAEIGSLRYGPENKDYFWINDTRPYMVIHPYISELNGRDISNFKDPKGKRLFVEFVKKAQASGSGYVDYYWQWKDDPSHIVPKLSYVKIFKPWNWIVGTGIYLEDVKVEMERITDRLIMFSLALMIVITSLSAYLIVRAVRHDIRRRRAETELGLTLARHRAVLEAVADPVVVYDVDGLVLYLNPAFTRVFGWTLDELRDRKIDFVPPEEIEPTQAVIKGLYQGRPGYSGLDTRRYTKDGRMLDIAVSAALFRDDKNRPIGMVVNLRDVSDQKKAELAMRESEERFRSISANALDGIIMLDHLGVVSFFNPAAEKIFGYTAKEIIGRRLHDLLVPEAAHDQYRSAFANFQETGHGKAIGRTLEMVAKKKDGRLFPVELSVSAMQLQGQWHSIGIVRDITQRLAAQNALRASEAKYRELVQQARNIIIRFDLTGKITFCNEYAVDFVGKSEKELIGRTVDPGILPLPEDGTKDMGLIISDLCAGAERSWYSESLVVRSNGPPAWIGWTSQAVTGESGEVEEILTIGLDLTEKKTTEEALINSESQFRTAFDNAPLGMALINLDRCFLRVNQQLVETLGYAEDELLGQDFNSFTHPDDIADGVARLERMKAGEIDYSWVEKRFLHRSGRVIWMLVSNALIRTSQNRPDHCVCHLQDITQRKNLEQQLRQSQKMEAVGTLAGGIAHDFNNLLQILSGSIQLIKTAELLPESLKPLCEQMDKTIDRGTDLIRQLMTFSRKVEPELKPVDLNELLDEAAAILKRTLPAMIEINRPVAESGPAVVFGDRNQIHQVLLNLGVNAGDAMPTGGSLTLAAGLVEIDPDHSDERLPLTPGRYVLMTVSDTGDGMEETILNNIFDPFFTTKEVGRGTGLGLAMVYGIVQNHRGHIKCSSRKGEGTRFDIYWSAADVVLDQDVDEPGATEPEGDDKAVTKGVTILLVDDEEAILAIAVEALAREGYRIMTASSGEEALEIYKSSGASIDLVVLDLGMPGMGGLACLSKIMEYDQEAKVIVSSGYTTDKNKHTAVEAGAKDFVPKPYRLNALTEVIGRILGQKE